MVRLASSSDGRVVPVDVPGRCPSCPLTNHGVIHGLPICWLQGASPAATASVRHGQSAALHPFPSMSFDRLRPALVPPDFQPASL